MIKMKEINDNIVEMIMPYDYELFQGVKQVPNSKFDFDEQVWIFEKKFANSLISHLKNMDSAIKVYTDFNVSKEDDFKLNSVKNKDSVKTVKVDVVRENKKSLVVSFDYDKSVNDIIKMIESDGRRYNPKRRLWTIRKEEIGWLKLKLDKLSHVNSTALQDYVNFSKTKVNKNDFPGMKLIPYDFQIEATNTMLKHRKIINSLEAGLGKTIVSIMAVEKLKAKTVIVCPATVKEHWGREISKVNPKASVNVLYSRDEYYTADYVILNYDILGKFYDHIANDGFEAIIFDEAHRLRGVSNRGLPTSQRADYGLKIAATMKYVFPLTATPFVNRTKDIYNLLRMIQHPTSRNWFTFANTYCGAKTSSFGTSYDGSSNQEVLYERLQPNGVIRMLAKDHLDLPELTRRFIPLKINLNKYEKSIKEYMDNRESITDEGEHLVALNAARKILSISKVPHAINLAKDLLDQGESVVILSNYSDVVEKISNNFKKESVIITGDNTGKDRQRSVDLFQSGKKRVLVGNAEAAGEGITLTKAKHMIVVDMHWSPVFMAKQMEKRIHRIGQDETANIHYLYAMGAKVDEEMARMAEDKLSNASLALDGERETFVDDLIELL